MKTVDVSLIIDSEKPQVGSSNPVAVLGSNGKKYILKNQTVYDKTQNGFVDENAVFMQEMLAYKFGKLLHIPVPNYAILNISSSFLRSKNNYDYLFKYHIENPGLYFGTEIIPNVENNLQKNYEYAFKSNQPKFIKSWTKYFSNVINPESYASILALDCFLLNADRVNNEGNLLVASDNNGKNRKVYAIDFGHCFWGPKWNSGKQNVMNCLINANDDGTDFTKWFVGELLMFNYNQQPALGFGKIFRAMESNIYFDDGNPFSDIIFKIESLTDIEILDILNSIPPIWFSGSEIQKNMYYAFLKLNKNNVRKAITLMYDLGAFSNNLGGALNWKVKNCIGIQ